LPDNVLQASGVVFRQTISALIEQSGGSISICHFVLVLFRLLELTDPPSRLSHDDFKIEAPQLLDLLSEAIWFSLTSDFVNFVGQIFRFLSLLIVPVLVGDSL
jgi:hypothetical protein